MKLARLGPMTSHVQTGFSRGRRFLPVHRDVRNLVTPGEGGTVGIYFTVRGKTEHIRQLAVPEATHT
jgi:hypothetical protein